MKVSGVSRLSLFKLLEHPAAFPEQRKVITTCTIDCGGKCPLEVQVSNGVIDKISPYDDGKIPPLKACVRGLNYQFSIYAPDRLKYPLIRVGERGSGRFKRLSWDEALDIVAREIRRVKENYGPEAILECAYAGAWHCLLHRTMCGGIYRLLNRLGGRTAFGTATSQEGAWWAARFTYGIRDGADASSLSDLVNSRLVILWGMNPAEARWGTDTLYWLQQAKKKGIKFVCVDPCYTDTVRILGAEHIPIRPSTDAAMLIAMAYVIVTENLHDNRFIDKYVFGFDRYRDYILGRSDGMPKTPEWAEKITGVPAATIQRIAREYASAKPAALLQGFAPGRTANGEQYHRAAIALQAMTGNIGVSGGSGSCDGIRFAPGLPANPIFSRDAENKLRYGGRGVEIKPATWSDAVLQGRAGGYPSDIKLIYVAGHNILTGRANVKKGVETFQKVEFVVCQDYFLTPTARYADIVLPATTSFERNDIARPWCMGDYVIFLNKAIEPLWEAKADLDIARGLAKRLGIEDFDTESEDERLKGFFYRSELPKKITYDEFKKQGIFRLETPPKIAFKEQIDDLERHPFPTATGKIEIYSQTLDKTDFNTEYSSVVQDYRGIPRIPTFLECEELPISAKAKRFPLQLTTPHHTHRAHSQFYNIPRLRQMYRHEVWINPIDAASRRIEDGDTVHIFNDLGTIQVLAKVTERMMPGVVRCYEGGWYDPDENGIDRGGCVNVLLDDRLTSPCGATNANTCLVDIKKA